jgi:hypothetical protein
MTCAGKSVGGRGGGFLDDDRDERPRQARAVGRREARQRTGQRQAHLRVGLGKRQPLQGVEGEPARPRDGLRPAAEDGVDGPGVGEEAHGLTAKRRRRIVEQRPEPRFVDRANRPQGPQPAQPEVVVLPVRKECVEHRHDIVELFVRITGGSPVGEDAGRHAGMPAVGGEEADERRGVESGEIGAGGDGG